METKFHLRARAVISHNGKFLLARAKGKGNTFLPGGHIELGESIVTTLKREAREEFGRDVVVKEYLGAVEHSFDENPKHFEINHIFYVEISDLDKNPEVHSLEEHEEFIWVSLDEFEKYNLQPFPLRELIKKWITGDTSPWWASTFYRKQDIKNEV